MFVYSTIGLSCNNFQLNHAKSWLLQFSMAADDYNELILEGHCKSTPAQFLILIEFLISYLLAESLVLIITIRSKMLDKIKALMDAAKESGIEPAKEAMNTRMKNPIFGSFILSWLFFNWEKLLIIVFGDGNILSRIDAVKDFNSNSVIFSINIPHAHTLWFPLLISLIFTLGNPFVLYLLDVFHNGIITKAERNKFDRQANILKAKTNLITAEVKNDTQKRTENLLVEAGEAISRAEIAESNSRIELLSNQASSLQEQIKVNEETNASLMNSMILKNKEIEVLQMEINDKEKYLLQLNSDYGEFDALTKKLHSANAIIAEFKEEETERKQLKFKSVGLGFGDKPKTQVGSLNHLLNTGIAPNPGIGVMDTDTLKYTLKNDSNEK